jgi:hypothetical protein
MDQQVHATISHLGFELFQSSVYMLQLENDSYCLLSRVGGKEIPKSFDDKVVMTMYEWQGPVCVERWAGLYSSLSMFLKDWQLGRPWIRHPQCATDGCRKIPENGKDGLCHNHKIRAN